MKDLSDGQPGSHLEQRAVQARHFREIGRIVPQYHIPVSTQLHIPPDHVRDGFQWLAGAQACSYGLEIEPQTGAYRFKRGTRV
jgi:hypothetical protein